VEVVVEAASFKTGNQQRDDHVRSSDYLDVARHPEIGFRSRLLERPGAGATLQGELTACRGIWRVRERNTEAGTVVPSGQAARSAVQSASVRWSGSPPSGQVASTAAVTSRTARLTPRPAGSGPAWDRTVPQVDRAAGPARACCTALHSVSCSPSTAPPSEPPG
jgi:hypothetical protein